MILQYGHIPVQYRDVRLSSLREHTHIQDWFENFGTHEFQPSLLLVCENIDARIKGRRYAIGTLLSLAEQLQIKPPAYYLSRSAFTDYWNQYIRGFDTGEDSTTKKKGELYLSSNLIIFDGVDEVDEAFDRKMMVSFLHSALDKGVPFIFLSHRPLDNQLATKYELHGIISKIRELSQTVTLS